MKDKIITQIKEIRPELMEYYLDEKSNIELVKKSEKQIPEKNSPILICLCKNENHILAEFLEHYKNIGIEYFVFIDNNSDDGTFETLLKQEEVTLFRAKDDYASHKRIAWINKIMDFYGEDRWYLVVDADELVVYDNCENYKIQNLIKFFENINLKKVKGMMIDMYPDKDLRKISPSDKLFETSKYFDAEGYDVKQNSITGGVRKRVFDINVALIKFPLFYKEKDDFMVNSHHAFIDAEIYNSPCFIGILHYKFHSDFFKKLEHAITSNCYFKNSIEYKTIAEKLDETDNIDFVTEKSTEYKTSQSLIETRLINKISYWKIDESLSPPLVSVLMAVYNGEKYIHQAIESILNQTYTNFEFLIVNDASTDNTKKIIEKYNDPRIKIIENNTNIKLAASLNKGLNLAMGEYIVRMDADDISRNDRIEKQVQFMEANLNVGVCGSWFSEINNPDAFYKPYCTSEQIKTAFLQGCAIAHPSCILRKSFFTKYNLKYDPEFLVAQDYELWTRAIHFFDFANIPEFLLYYRKNQEGTGAKNRELQKQNGTKIIYRQIKELCPDISDKDFEIFLSFIKQNFSYSQNYVGEVWKVLTKFIEANDIKKEYSAEILDKYFKNKWYRLCRKK